MTRNEALKQLMLGLIYPAVLGTIFYNFLSIAVEPVLYWMLGRSVASFGSGIKWALLLATIIFYCCDYFYIMFTREFVPAFFICDLILLAGLYMTFLSIDVRTSILPRRNLVVLAGCYTLFMTLYLTWDIFEHRRTTGADERLLYKKVIIWEAISVIVLLIWLGAQFWFPSFNHDAVLLTSILVVITVWFFKLASDKRVFYKSMGRDAECPRIDVATL